MADIDFTDNEKNEIKKIKQYINERLDMYLSMLQDE